MAFIVQHMASLGKLTVDNDLQVKTACIILNYCYVCCSEMTLLFKNSVCSETGRTSDPNPRHDYYHLSLLVEDSRHWQEGEEESLFQRQAEPQTDHCVGCGSVSKALKAEQCR